MRRSGTLAAASRPELETFGESVGVLTREVFGLEVTQTGFHQLLAEAAERQRSFDAVASEFEDQLGGEARALLRGLLASQRPRRTA